MLLAPRGLWPTRFQMRSVSESKQPRQGTIGSSADSIAEANFLVISLLCESRSAAVVWTSRVLGYRVGLAVCCFAR